MEIVGGEVDGPAGEGALVPIAEAEFLEVLAGVDREQGAEGVVDFRGEGGSGGAAVGTHVGFVAEVGEDFFRIEGEVDCVFFYCDVAGGVRQGLVWRCGGRLGGECAVGGGVGSEVEVALRGGGGGGEGGEGFGGDAEVVREAGLGWVFGHGCCGQGTGYREQGTVPRLEFVASHPLRKRRAKDGAPGCVGWGRKREVPWTSSGQPPRFARDDSITTSPRKMRDFAGLCVICWST